MRAVSLGLSTIGVLLVLGVAGANDIPPKTVEYEALLPADVADAVKTLVEGMPSKYALSVAVRETNAGTEISLKGDPLAVEVFEMLVQMHTGSSVTRGQHLKAVIEFRRKNESRQNQFVDLPRAEVQRQSFTFVGSAPDLSRFIDDARGNRIDSIVRRDRLLVVMSRSAAPADLEGLLALARRHNLARIGE